MVWLIKNNLCDLTDFITRHPGGSKILELTNNTGDITALFDSYHAFSDKEKIYKMMKQYELNDKPETAPLYDMELYNELALKVKQQCNYDRSNIKASMFKTSFLLCCFVLYADITYLCMFIFSHVMKASVGFILGFLWIVFGLNMMHEGSHYALVRNTKLNLLCSRLWNGFGLWNGDVWQLHHVIYHHRFTGSDSDPDVYHLRPFYKKNNKNKSLKCTAYLFPLVLFIFPGYYLGQAISYFLGYKSGKVFGMPIPSVRLSTIDLLLMISRLCIFYFIGIHASIMHIISNNIFYGVNVLADHDTYEALVENHYSGNDWLKLQVRNSANFYTNSYVYTYLFGGINYQIEHHLFPNMSSIHYKAISPIVREFCKEHDIKYTVHNSIYEIMKEYYKSLKHFN